MKKDFKYIIKRIIIGVGIILIMSFINSCQVHAETFSIQDNYGIIYYNPAGYDINNTRQNNLYYNSSSANPASIKSRGYIYNNEDGSQGADQGSYLIDIYIYGVGTFYQSYSCTGFNSNFGWMNSTDGSWNFSSSVSKSQCIAIEKTTYNNYQAIHLLYRWDIVDTYGGGVGGADIQVTQYNLFTAGSSGTNIGYALGSLVPYDLSIVESFKNGQYMQNIENAIQTQTQTQHQDSLNEQQAINNVNDSINDSSIPSDSSNKINAITNAITTNQNSSIVQLATFIPQTLQLILNGFNTSCTGGYSLGSLYGTELTIPCINPVDYLGSFLWGVIDSILCLCYLIPLCKFLVNKYNDLTSMKNLRWQ